MRLDGRDLGLGVGLLGPFVGHHLPGGRLHETLVRELLHHAREEPFLIGQFVRQFASFRFGVDFARHRHEVLRRLDNERCGRRVFLRHRLDGRQVGHFPHHGGVLGRVVLVGDYLERQRLLLRQVLLVADVAHRGDHLPGQFEPRQQLPVGFGRLGHRGDGDRLALFARGEVLPDLFRHEGHEGVQHAHQGVEERACGFERRRVDRLPVGGFHHLQVQAAEVVPEELVGRLERLRNAVGAEIVGDLAQSDAECLAEPCDRQAVVLVLCGLAVRRPAVHQAVGVPYLVAEVASLLAERLVEHHVVACRRGDEHRHAHTVGAVFGDQVERVGRVAQLLGHLAADLVADDAREIDVAEGFFAAVFVTRHDHARHPEEDDVGARHQVVGGVVVADLPVAGVADAVEDRNRPQPRREPRVQHVVVLSEVGWLQRGVAGFRARLFECLPSRRGHYEAALGQVPGRDALAPP